MGKKKQKAASKAPEEGEPAAASVEIDNLEPEAESARGSKTTRGSESESDSESENDRGVEEEMEGEGDSGVADAEFHRQLKASAASRRQQQQVRQKFEPPNRKAMNTKTFNHKISMACHGVPGENDGLKKEMDAEIDARGLTEARGKNPLEVADARLAVGVLNQVFSSTESQSIIRNAFAHFVETHKATRPGIAVANMSYDDRCAAISARHGRPMGGTSRGAALCQEIKQRCPQVTAAISNGFFKQHYDEFGDVSDSFAVLARVFQTYTDAMNQSRAALGDHFQSGAKARNFWSLVAQNTQLFSTLRNLQVDSTQLLELNKFVEHKEVYDFVTAAQEQHNRNNGNY